MKALAFACPLLLALLVPGCSDQGGGESGVRVQFDLALLEDGNLTPFGSFVVETDAEHAPKTVENFLAYVDSGYYVNLTFHRIAPGFVVQAGGYEADYQTRHEARPPIPLEATLEEPNVQWSLSMARTNVPDSATSEFFVNLVDNIGGKDAEGNPRANLNPTGPGTGYAVFGHVVSGFDTIEEMLEVPAGASFGNAGGYYPATPIVITACHRL